MRNFALHYMYRNGGVYMQINLPKDKLQAFLDTNEDCEALAGGEYVADLFEGDMPITVNLRMENGECVVLAAARLLYDEEQDGWYMGERIEDEKLIADAFMKAMEA